MKKLFVIFLILTLIVPLKSEKEPVKVLIDNYHSNEDSNPINDFRVFRKTLEKDFSFEVKMKPITKELLKEYKILILANPHKPLSKSEIDTILDFVENGGSVLMGGVASSDWNDEARDSYNTLAKEFGFRFMKSTVKDVTNNIGCLCTPVFHNINRHEITFGIGEIAIRYPASIEVKDGEILVYGDDDTYNIGDEKVWGEDVVVAMANIYGNGKVVALGSLSIFLDSRINFNDNLVFAKNVMNWLSKSNVPPKRGRSEVVILTNEIDRNLVLESYFKKMGLEIFVVSPLEFESYKEYKFIIILGGPDAPQTSKITQKVLSEREKEYLRQKNNSNAYLKRDVWRENQIVFVLAGNDRNLTREVVLKSMYIIYEIIVEGSY